jgi:hypothetical protein
MLLLARPRLIIRFHKCRGKKVLFSHCLDGAVCHRLCACATRHAALASWSLLQGPQQAAGTQPVALLHAAAAAFWHLVP